MTSIQKSISLGNGHLRNRFVVHIYLQTDRELLSINNSSISTINVPQQIKNQLIIQSIFQNFRIWNWDPDYQRNFLAVRNNQTEDEIKQTISYSLYREFICGHIVRILQEIYGLSDYEFSKMHYEIEMALKDSAPCLYQDLLGYQTVLAVVSVAELMDKIIDGDLNNAFCLISLLFTDVFSIKISTAALAISFFNFKLLQRKIEDNGDKTDNSKQNLPKITLLHFAGYYSKIDIDIICEFSENVQIIMIYDSSTGGPNLAQSSNVSDVTEEAEEDSRATSSQRIPIDKRNSNILLLPLACFHGKKVNSEDLWQLFERVIYPSIIRFSPELIVINHSFNFHPTKIQDTNDSKFVLDKNAWDSILYKLCLISQYRVLIIPHKLISPREYYRKTDLITDNVLMKNFLVKVDQIYGRPWDLQYVEAMYVSSLEILTGRKIPLKDPQDSKDTLNFLSESQIWRVLKSYKDHPIYGFLSSEMYCLLAAKKQLIVKHFIKPGDSILSNPANQGANIAIETINQTKDSKRELSTIIQNELWMKIGTKAFTITLFNIEKLEKLSALSVDEIASSLRVYELFFESEFGKESTNNDTTLDILDNAKEILPFIPRAESQYLADYQNKTLYYFNVLYKSKYSHFTFQINPSISKLTGKYKISLNKNAPRYFCEGDEGNEQKSSTLFDLGLCLGNNKIFSVYGQAHYEQQLWDSDGVYYYDITGEKWIKPKISLKRLSSGEKMIARHGVTCCYVHFSEHLHSKHLLYAIGGESSNQNESQKKVIMNVMEFFTLDFKINQFEYFIIDKKSFLKKEIWLVPYYHSLCFEAEGKLLIFGGEHYENSSYEENLQNKVFCLDTQKKDFDKINCKIRAVPNLMFENKITSLIRSSSKNMLTYKNSAIFVLNANPGESLVLKASFTAKILEFDMFFHQSSEKKTLIGVDKPINPESDVLENKKVSNFTKSLNFLKSLGPETALLTYLILQAFNRMIKEGQHLNESICVQAIIELLSDPIIKCSQNFGIARAFVQLNQILEVTVGDTNIRTLLEEIKKLLDENKVMIAYNLNEFERSAALQLRGKILEDKSKDDIIQILEEHISYLLRTGSLILQTALRADRIFQRASANIQPYHQPIFDEGWHRWMTVDPNYLLTLNQLELRNLIFQEDTGILRDLAVGFSKIIDFRVKMDQIKSNTKTSELQQSFTDQKMLVSTPEHETEDRKSTIWEDDQQDKLAKSTGNVNTSTASVDLDIYSNFHMNKVVKIFTMVLAELARREKIVNLILGKSSEFENTKLTDDISKKWENLKHKRPSLWDILVSCLEEKPANIDNAIENFVSNKNYDMRLAVDSQVGTNEKKHEINTATAQSVFASYEERKVEYLPIISSQKVRNSEEFEPSEKKTIMSSENTASFNLSSQLMSSELREDKKESQKITVHLESTKIEHLKSAKDKTSLGPRKTDRERRKNMSSLTKTYSSIASAILIPLILQTPIYSKLRVEIKYHSAQNLKDAHSSQMTSETEPTQYYISPEGSTIKRKFNGKWLQARLCVYHAQTNHITPFYLEKNQFSSLCIWNNVAYLYFDEILTKRFVPTLREHFEHCLLYSDLREAFEMSGATKGVIVFVPILKNHFHLSNRTIMADDSGVFLIGGSKVAFGSRSIPISYSNKCSHYSLQALEKMMEQSNNQESQESGAREEENTMDSMELKRDDLVACQTANKIFVTARISWASLKNRAETQIDVEVFNKIGFYWEAPMCRIHLSELTDILSLSIFGVIKDRGQESILLLGTTSSQDVLKYILSSDEDQNNKLYIKSKEKIARDDAIFHIEIQPKLIPHRYIEIDIDIYYTSWNKFVSLNLNQ